LSRPDHDSRTTHHPTGAGIVAVMTDTPLADGTRRHRPAGTPQDGAAVRAEGLHRRFGAVHAVRGVDLTVAPGEIVALLGPNGAGKSTTVDLLLGLLPADAGSARIFGRTPRQAVDQGLVGATLQVGDIERLGRQALAEVRATASGYRTASLPAEIAGARAALTAAGITAELPQATDDVPERYREAFAYVLREAVTNVIRHSGATRCVVRLGSDRVEVIDDGCPSTPDAIGGPGRPDGVSGGLHGLSERLAAIGGRLEAGAAEGGGFRLVAFGGAE
jgi:hypothetical protein